jgi:hypothetical protein
LEEEAGHGAHLFDPEQQQNRLEEIRELRGKYQEAQGSFRCRFFRGKR